MTERLTLVELHTDLGISRDTPGFGVVFGQRSRAALDARLTNRNAPALTEADFKAAADRLGVPVGHIRGIRRVEAPRGPYEDSGKPSILYERHKFRAACVPPGCYDKSHPQLSGGPYGRGGYGLFSAQYGRLYDAIALDPHAAFSACSWGAFQVMGEWAVPLGYGSPYDMAKSLTTGEAAHLETFVRYVEHFKLVDELRACKRGDPESCRAFAAGYNGSGYRQFEYHKKLAAAITS